MEPFVADLAEIVPVLAADWPGRPLSVMPGDLLRFAPQGFGLGAPMIVTPWGGQPAQGYYGFDAAEAHP